MRRGRRLFRVWEQIQTPPDLHEVLTECPVAACVLSLPSADRGPIAERRTPRLDVTAGVATVARCAGNQRGWIHLLVLTERALEAVRTLVRETPEPSEKTGLRIRAEPVGEDSFLLDVKVVEAPAENDFRLEEGDVRVYLEQGAFLHLNDKVLDAKTDEQKVVFSVSEQ